MQDINILNGNIPGGCMLAQNMSTAHVLHNIIENCLELHKNMQCWY